MNFDAMPASEVKQEDLNAKLEEVKKEFMAKALEKVTLAPESERGERMEEAFKLYGAFFLVSLLNMPGIGLEGIQGELKQKVQAAGFDTESVIAQLKDYTGEAKKENQA